MAKMDVGRKVIKILEAKHVGWGELIDGSVVKEGETIDKRVWVVMAPRWDPRYHVRLLDYTTLGRYKQEL